MIRRNVREPELVLEYNGKNVSTDEANVSDVINTTTEERTDNIYDQIKDIIMEYITPEESIMLNVLSVIVDFTTCESIKMSHSVDKTGLRTLVVVTKADRSPEGLLEKVKVDDVNTSLGYICVRNRIGDESYEEARNEEHKLFESHSLLSKIDKCIVGFLALAQKLVHVQAMIISKTLSEITKKINEKLNNNLKELENLPASLSSLTDAMSIFMQIVALSRDSLRNILLIGDF
ncbi:unnamed protein product [Vicia faba]|uniref:Dynamin-type G domain-containing protein n=1 Tax=Vicia faba TaxID=3906 RepID=A0AAV0Z5K7_VICFA|nr:unnamed protein product [Vicia faba]